MTDLLYTMAAYTVGQLALFGLALLAYVRWQVPMRDLIVLLRECRLRPPSSGRRAIARRARSGDSVSMPEPDRDARR
jgi:hypothetical protein